MSVIACAPTPEPEDRNEFAFILVDGKFIYLDDIDEFLKQNYEKFKNIG